MNQALDNYLPGDVLGAHGEKSIRTFGEGGYLVIGQDCDDYVCLKLTKNDNIRLMIVGTHMVHHFVKIDSVCVEDLSIDLEGLIDVGSEEYINFDEFKDSEHAKRAYQKLFDLDHLRANDVLKQYFR